MCSRSILASLLILSPSAALATGEIEGLITDHDRQRLEDYETTRDEAVAEAKEGGSEADIAVMEEVLEREPVPFEGFDMTGYWQCRTIKVGGLASLVVYGWFDCRVIDDGSGWMLEKLSGSQRTKGRFFTESDTRLTYLGSYFVAGDTPKKYGNGPETDQVGYAYRSGEDTWRIEFPAPARESKLDVLEFRR
ncbi:uncharacterized protein DUF4893 [Mesorhizobium sp. J18]|uniref:DUF4893 domain-containing protein n=1 Tax=Mesorhizobium sp. J18 TaxID=935263 RepID=UPI00119B4AF0|nr:DUF4893 domain-containing protein [Mesorhizobium sp. J18]TWG93851.1 uncharacterized protein DUF4893 [Mesorhizobium sp. J18]